MAAPPADGGFDAQVFAGAASDMFVRGCYGAFVTFGRGVLEATEGGQGLPSERLEAIQAGLDSFIEFGLGNVRHCASKFEEFAVECMQPPPPLTTSEVSPSFLPPEVPDWDPGEETQLMEETERKMAEMKKAEDEVCKLQKKLSAMKKLLRELEATGASIEKIFEPLLAKEDEFRELDELMKSTQEMMVDAERELMAWRERVTNEDDDSAGVMTDHLATVAPVFEDDPQILQNSLE
eukprot:evm.model.scf_50.11 EVM.evm.TU.scf_50.11   scf_50:175376-180518(-)